MKSNVHKGIVITLAATLASSLVISCASTSNTAAKNQSQLLINEENGEAQTLHIPTQAELYAQKTESVRLSLVSSPKQVTKGKIFTEPYTIKVENQDGSPASSFELAVNYPSSRNDGTIVFEQTVITTDSQGLASFLPPPPDFSFNSEISFFTNGNMTDPEIAAFAKEHSLNAPFKVQTNLKSAGGTLALVDFNQNGKAIISNPVSSSNLLMTLMKLGFTKIGNAPQDVSEAVIQGSDEKVYSRAKAIAPAFIIYGTIKIDSIEKTDEGVTCTLSASIKAMDSKTGKITFRSEKTIAVTEKNDWNATASARKLLAEQMAEEIKYGI